MTAAPTNQVGGGVGATNVAATSPTGHANAPLLNVSAGLATLVAAACIATGHANAPLVSVVPTNAIVSR